MSAPIMSRFDLFFVILDECNEQHDYAIARHLLNVHRYRDAPVEAEFSAEQIQRYIRYCRTIRPKIGSEAAGLLVERYKQLRAGDATGTGTAYRITVRQLESLIRLSEALARLHSDTEVRPAYVQEACRLLKSSIIRVEMDNVDLTMSSGAFSEAAATLNEAVKGIARPTAGLHTSFSLKYDEYVRITNMLVYQLRRAEAEADEQREQNGGNSGTSPGMRRSTLIGWFLEQVEAEIGTEVELEQRQGQIGAVIDRLIGRDHVLLSIKPGGGLAVDGQSGNDDDDPFLVVHPNYAY